MCSQELRGMYRVVRGWQAGEEDNFFIYHDANSAIRTARLAVKKGYRYMCQILGDEDFWGCLWS